MFNLRIFIPLFIFSVPFLPNITSYYFIYIYIYYFYYSFIRFIFYALGLFQRWFMHLMFFCFKYLFLTIYWLTKPLLRTIKHSHMTFLLLPHLLLTPRARNRIMRVSHCRFLKGTRCGLLISKQSVFIF